MEYNLNPTDELINETMDHLDESLVEYPFRYTPFYACLCFMSRVVMIMAMVLVAIKFSHILPHHEEHETKKHDLVELREAETERKEEEIPEDKTNERSKLL